VVGLIVGISAFFAAAGPAGAATVTGSFTPNDIQATSVSFTVTGQRTCAADEQCDYYSDLEDLTGGGDCPTTYPADPWNTWNGQVQNTGPTTETGTVSPRGWLAGGTGPERMCLFIFADGIYYYVGGADLTPPDPNAGTAGSWTPTEPPPARPSTGTTTTPTSGTSGGSSGTRTPTPPARRLTVATVALTKASTSAKAALKRTYGRKFTKGKRYRATCRRVSKTHVRCAVSWSYRGTWKGTVDVTGAIRSNRQVLVAKLRVRRPKS
jgi:hypothetical protein